MSKQPEVRVLEVKLRGTEVPFPAELVATGAAAQQSFTGARAAVGVHLLLVGERDYHVVLTSPGTDARASFAAQLGKKLHVHFKGRSTAVRRSLAAVGGQDPALQTATTPPTTSAPPKVML